MFRTGREQIEGIDFHIIFIDTVQIADRAFLTRNRTQCLDFRNVHSTQVGDEKKEKPGFETDQS
jgi:hypothetical protein